MNKLQAACMILPITVASAAQAAPIGSDWPVIASVRDGDCALQITGNGKIFLIAATGLKPEQTGRYQIASGDMRPIDWNVRVTNDGRAVRYYLPFRWGQAGERIDGGVVDVVVTAPGCALNASFPWKRIIRVID
ncbi:hypothetical protein [Novosphingobium sp.]|uniref:hypothetical protein n=1 Tax=Novosphingobium sp. TaxID=1874826 RepID=UPI0025F01016|nr:hypothetical protein [Novosphingobium sp.]